MAVAVVFKDIRLPRLSPTRFPVVSGLQNHTTLESILLTLWKVPLEGAMCHDLRSLSFYKHNFFMPMLY